MKNQPEYQLQTAVCDYLAAQYPNVLFLSDTVAQVKLTMPQAVRNKRIQKAGFKCPDLMIFESRGEHHGLFIELKTETPYRKNGLLKSNTHLKAQDLTLQLLRRKGYYADFYWEFGEIKKTIDWYLRKF